MKKLGQIVGLVTYVLVMFVLVLWWFATWANAQPYYAAPPLLVVGPQGRPIPNGTFSVANTAGVVQTVYGNSSGTTVVASPTSSGAVPSQPIPILSFYAAPGSYLVTVSGEGVTRQYPVVVSAPATTTTPIPSQPSVYRGAANWNVQLTTSPGYVAPVGGAAPYLAFAGGAGTSEVAEIDFLMPSYALSHVTSTLTWGPATSAAGSVAWQLAYCTYAEGEARCTPSFGSNVVTLVSPAPGVAGQRIDAVADSPTDWNTSWAASTHVVIHLRRNRTNPSNTYGGEARFEGLQLEFQR